MARNPRPALCDVAEWDRASRSYSPRPRGHGRLQSRDVGARGQRNLVCLSVSAQSAQRARNIRIASADTTSTPNLATTRTSPRNRNLRAFIPGSRSDESTRSRISRHWKSLRLSQTRFVIFSYERALECVAHLGKVFRNTDGRSVAACRLYLEWAFKAERRHST
jgi:hypothetical protein